MYIFGSMKAAWLAIPDSKGLQTDHIKQWFSNLAAHQKNLGSLQAAVAEVPPQTSEVSIFPVDANAAARVENHCTKFTGVLLLNSENKVNPVLCSCLGRRGHKQLPTCKITVAHLEFSMCSPLDAHLGAVLC